MTFEDAIAYSRNVVAAKVALELGQEHEGRPARKLFYDLAARSGFGSPTGIDVANEVGGIVRDPAANAVARDRPRQRRVRPGRSP